jgi:hypothetical protein
LLIGDIPPTPNNQKALIKNDQSSEKLILQATALLGDPIGYVQEGNIINNFFPLESFSNAPSSNSYDTELDLHTENVFHTVSPDYILLLCLREDPNASAITYISPIDQVAGSLLKDDIIFFKQEKFNFLSDYSHTDKNCRIDIGKHQTVLYGPDDNLLFRFDPYFMVAHNESAHEKLKVLREIAWKMAIPIKLKRGDLLIIDNRKAAHARGPFKANFDGNDRWIQRTFSVNNHRFYSEKFKDNSRIFELRTE